MSKEAYYFSHDANARYDPKILAMRSVYGAAGYGWYWMIIEILREQPDFKLEINKYTWNALAMQMQSDADAIKKFVEDCINEFGLFKSDGKFIWSESLIRRMEKMTEKSEKARKAAKSRWEKDNKSNALAMQTQSGRNADAMQLNEMKRNEMKLNKNNNTHQCVGCVDGINVDKNEVNVNINDTLTKIVEVYENLGYGTVTKGVADILLSLVNEFSFEWVKEALHEGMLQNKRSLKYVQAILDRWRAEGGIDRSFRKEKDKQNESVYDNLF
jgi:DnaD/phage-associated family protein